MPSSSAGPHPHPIEAVPDDKEPGSFFNLSRLSYISKFQFRSETAVSAIPQLALFR